MSTGGSHDFITFTPPLPDDPSTEHEKGFSFAINDDDPFGGEQQHAAQNTGGIIGASMPSEADSGIDNDNPFSISYNGDNNVHKQQPQHPSVSLLLPEILELQGPTAGATTAENETNNLNLDDDNPFFSELNPGIAVNLHKDDEGAATTEVSITASSTQHNTTINDDDDNPFKMDINTSNTSLDPFTSSMQSADDPNPFALQDSTISNSNNTNDDPFTQQEDDDQVPRQFIYGNDPFALSEDPFSEQRVPQHTASNDIFSFDDSITFESTSPQKEQCNESEMPDINIQFSQSQDLPPPPVPQRPPKPITLTAPEAKGDASAPTTPTPHSQHNSLPENQGTWISSFKKAAVIQRAMSIWNKPHDSAVIGVRSAAVGSPASDSELSSSARSSIDGLPGTPSQTNDDATNGQFVQFVENKSLTSLTQLQISNPQPVSQSTGSDGNSGKGCAVPVKFLQVCVPDYHALKMVEFEPLENGNSLVMRVLESITSEDDPNQYKLIYPVFLGGQTMRAFEMDRWAALGTYGLGMQVREDVPLIFVLRNTVGSNYDFQKYEVYTKKMMQTPNDTVVSDWLDILDSWGSSSIRLITKRKRLRKLTAAGIPYAVRGWAWCQLADTFSIKEKNVNVYNELLDKIFEMPQEYERKIRVDLPRSLPTHPFFKEEGLGQDSLNRILKCYCNYDEEIRYCQGINFLSAMLLCYMNECVNINIILIKVIIII